MCLVHILWIKLLILSPIHSSLHSHVSFANTEDDSTPRYEAICTLREIMYISYIKGINLDTWPLGSSQENAACMANAPMDHCKRCVSSASANRLAHHFLIASWLDVL